jgi:hypothetical protein
MAEILFVWAVLPQAGVNFNSEFAAQDRLFPKMAYNETFLLIGWSFNLE